MLVNVSEAAQVEPASHTSLPDSESSPTPVTEQLAPVHDAQPGDPFDGDPKLPDSHFDMEFSVVFLLFFVWLILDATNYGVWCVGVAGAGATLFVLGPMLLDLGGGPRRRPLAFSTRWWLVAFAYVAVGLAPLGMQVLLLPALALYLSRLGVGWILSFTVLMATLAVALMPLVALVLVPILLLYLFCCELWGPHKRTSWPQVGRIARKTSGALLVGSAIVTVLLNTHHAHKEWAKERKRVAPSGFTLVSSLNDQPTSPPDGRPVVP